MLKILDFDTTSTKISRTYVWEKLRKKIEEIERRG